MQINFIALLLLLLGEISAQNITYTTTIKNSLCGGLNNGSAEITVTSTNGPYSFLWSNGDNDNIATDLSPGDYSVTIIDHSSNATTATVTISEIACNFNAELVFTPNGDGIADTWYISGLSEYTNSLIIVYNRMGQKVYENKGVYEPWEGNDIFGKPLPDGTYFYLIYPDKKSKKPAEKGSVSILR